MGGMHQVGLDHQVLVDELGRVGVVRVDAAHPGRGQVHLVDGALLEKPLHRLLVDQVNHVATGGQNVAVAQRLQPPDNGRTHHAAMAGHENALIHIPAHGQFSTAMGVSSPFAFRKAWRCAARRSSATISAHISRTVISGTQPSRSFARVGSPSSVSTSVGRK